jgi:hypothetical protein
MVTVAVLTTVGEVIDLAFYLIFSVVLLATADISNAFST